MDLPEFKRRSRAAAQAFAAEIFTSNHLRDLITFDDGHFRAVFSPEYFTLAEGREEPSKSQWNSLKKRMKRHDRMVFVFKEHGEVPCESPSGKCYYIDFGFFAY
jgi:hypothetical protein